MGTHRRGAGPIWEWANALLESEIGFPGPARQVSEPTAPERTEGWTEDPLGQRLRNLEWPTVERYAREGSWLRFQGLLDSAEVGAHQADRGSDQPETERRGSG